MNTITLDKREVESVTLTEEYMLLIRNDNYNTFQWVINCLMDVCKHSMEQAEQCTLLIHHKGQCIVKVGDKETLNKMKLELLNRELDVILRK